jgi:hypothetical protein
MDYCASAWYGPEKWGTTSLLRDMEKVQCIGAQAILLPFRATGMSDMAVTMTYADVPSPQTGTTSFPPTSDKTLSPGQPFTPFPAGKTNKSTKINLYTIWYDQLECRDITHGLSH